MSKTASAFLMVMHLTQNEVKSYILKHGRIHLPTRGRIEGRDRGPTKSKLQLCPASLPQCDGYTALGVKASAFRSHQERDSQLDQGQVKIMNLIEATKAFATEKQCLAYLEAKRWPNGIRCLTCGSKEISHITRKVTAKSDNKRAQLY